MATSGGRAEEGVRRPIGPPPLALRLMAVLAVPVLLYALVATGQKALDNYRLNQQAENLRVQVRTLKDENVRLQRDIVEARTDVAVEKIARAQLGLVKQGDNALILSSDGRPSGRPQATPAPRPPELPVWKQWLRLFFGPRAAG